MSRLRLHPENHLVTRIGWLWAVILGASDGIVSTARLWIDGQLTSISWAQPAPQRRRRFR
jgi:VIT1/CCC1 family predicted Fe2+/Mn2+ transporter